MGTIVASNADDGPLIWAPGISETTNEAMAKLAHAEPALSAVERARPRSQALQKIYDRRVGQDETRAQRLEENLDASELARGLYRCRVEAGLTQSELARRLGTSTSVVCRLEKPGYEGHTLSTLRRVAAALGRRVEVRFPPIEVARERKRPETARRLIAQSYGMREILARLAPIVQAVVHLSRKGQTPREIAAETGLREADIDRVRQDGLHILAQGIRAS